MKRSDPKRKFWRFRCGHIGGEIVTIDGVAGLVLFEQALVTEPQEYPPMFGYFHGHLDGTGLTVRCTICGATRDWFIGQDSLDKFDEDLRRAGYG